MALETPIDFDGFVQINGNDICVCPAGQVLQINTIKFNNTANTAWTIEVYQKRVGYTPRLLYKMNLDAGDWINDTDGYQLKPDCTIWAKASVASVSYIINANQQV